MADTYGGYPQSAVNNAKRGIKLNEEQGNKCATLVGKNRAKDIVAKRPFSLSVLKRVYSYLSRAKEYYKPSDDEACGTISYLLWGGESMRTWSKKKLEQIEKEENRQVSAQVKKGLENKVKDHNEDVKDLDVSWNPKTTYSELLKVFERGIGAYKTNPQSVRPSVKSPEQWAYARVNSFLYALKKGKFRSGKHDTDLLPDNHPVKKEMKEDKNIDMKKLDRKLVGTMINDGIEMPLYDNKEEAIEYAEEMGGTGFHEHTLDDNVVYMPFESHEQIMDIMGKKDEENQMMEEEEMSNQYDEDKYRNLTKEEGFERRTFNTTEMRLDKENERRVVGYASVFNSMSENLGGFRELISERAFDDVMEDSVVALINHDMNFPLARTDNGTLTLSVDSKGLRYSFDVPEGLSYGNDLLINLRSGNIFQSSFGFIVEEDSWERKDGEHIRTIEKVSRLIDVSPVTIPAYPEATAQVSTVAKRNLNLQKEKHENQKEEQDLHKRNLIELKLKIIKNKKNG